MSFCHISKQSTIRSNILYGKPGHWPRASTASLLTKLSPSAKRYPGQLFAVHANVTDEETITAAVAQIISKAGALHGMVVNAGRTRHKAALDFTKEEIESLLSVNLFGAFHSARTTARAFIKLGIKGFVIFMASIASYRPNKAGRPFAQSFWYMYQYQEASFLHLIRRHKSRHPREQCFSGSGQDCHDLLGPTAAGLGVAAEILWRTPQTG